MDYGATNLNLDLVMVKLSVIYPFFLHYLLKIDTVAECTQFHQMLHVHHCIAILPSEGILIV